MPTLVGVRPLVERCRHLPTGIHLADARTQLFDAAESVLRRDGPGSLTSRSVAAEAGVAKGVIHRYFPEFDAFLAELILDRVSRLATPADRLHAAAGVGDLVASLTDAVVAVFGPVLTAEVALVVTRDGLREHLNRAGAPRLPLLASATELVRSYLAAEQDRGRIHPETDAGALAPTLIGALHLLYTEHLPNLPGADAVSDAIQTVLNATRPPSGGIPPATRR